MTDGVGRYALPQFIDEHRRPTPTLRNDDPLFRAFGGICYAVPSGAIRTVSPDDRTGNVTHGRLEEYRLGEGKAGNARLTNAADVPDSRPAVAA